ncbi:hypothetical protein SAICODRAFT_72353 [Saitoella complicata NRRL Y-17804]|uniref:uncharacterized protein n=1 Tax=Saitoella complicata (strain BCRC 22490 / CBS 7301 / JCM 7358 / NBRC 10748 / NRRL Y-17804) TaxID=698492 RepID=UPI000867D532|nr:uncharacterized protein SAICODRAFT_72353 [Saitoella complicata NRRL Y-17804]ODQ51730.1 hypothetical protein SAICODRAFT_72353 [Saitoella complicata NRRL Y-17804]
MIDKIVVSDISGSKTPNDINVHVCPLLCIRKVKGLTQPSSNGCTREIIISEGPFDRWAYRYRSVLKGSFNRECTRRTPGELTLQLRSGLGLGLRYRLTLTEPRARTRTSERRVPHQIREVPYSNRTPPSPTPNILNQDKLCTRMSSSQLKQSPVCIADLEDHAKTKLNQMTYEYYHCGANDQETVKDNLEAYRRYKLRPRVLRDVSTVNTSTTLFGTEYSLPLGIAPSAMQRLAGGNGELDTSRAAARAGVPMCLSTFATTSLEEVIAAGREVSKQENMPENDYWLQLYVYQNRQTSEKLVKRAEAAGFSALVLTVDSPWMGKRYNELRNNFMLPAHLELGNFKGMGVKTYGELETLKRQGKAVDPTELEAALAAKNVNDASLSWDMAIDWLRSITKMKIIVKGLITEEDALLALDHKVDAIWISNHGGRQLDGSVSTLDALPEIARVAKGKVPILFDGGVTRGTDILKAVALGADMAFIGRSVLWGLAYDGQAGVELALGLLRSEFELGMALSGCAKVGDIKRELLGVVRADGYGLAKL